MGYRAVPHTADLAIEASGDSLADLFRWLALGLGFLVAGKSRENVEISYKISIEAQDREALLVRFLNRLIYLFDTTGFVTSLVDVAIDGSRLQGNVSGFCLKQPARHCVKAATYHGLEIADDGGVFRATVIFDD
jgi:SHS2 domain-containing protein